MKYSPFSYSKISLFKECPKKWYAKYVEKSLPSENKPAFEKGSFVHYALQHYPAAPPKPFTFKLADEKMQTEWFALVKKILSNERIQRLCKNRVASEFPCILDEGFTQGTNRWKSMMYGVMDHLCVEDGELLLVDWKTGTSRGCRDQLKFYAAWVLIVRPNLQKIKCSFEYVEMEESDVFEFTRDELSKMLAEIESDIQTIETAEKFEARPGRGCDYCPMATTCSPIKVRVPKRP